MAEFAIGNVAGAPPARGKCCVAVDRSGNPHIAYSALAGHVVIASRGGDSWSIEEVTGSGLVRPEIEERVWLAIGSDGNPQIAFIGGEGTLIHGAKRDGSWTFTNLPTNRFNQPGGVSGFGFALCPGRLTPELRDTPHLVASDLSTDSLIFVRRIGGAFQRAVVTPSVDFSGDGDFNATGLASSMMFDEGSETINIAYVETIAGISRVRLRRILDVEAGTASNEQVLEQGNFFVAATSIWTGSETWMAYCDITNEQLKVATSAAGDPIVEKVADVLGRMVPSLARNAGLAARPEASLRIAYSDQGRLKLATRQQAVGWSVVEIDDAEAGTPSLAYDNAAGGHIAYTTGSTLKYVKVTE